MIDVSTVITAIAGSSLIAGYLQLQGERRQGRTSRSDIVKVLASVEKARWADGKSDLDGFNKVAREFEVVAVVTGVRRDVTEAYLTWSYVGARRSFESLDETGGDLELGGGIDATLAVEIDKLARLVSDSAWRPLRHRLYGGRDLKAVEESIEARVSEHFKTGANRAPWRRHAR